MRLRALAILLVLVSAGVAIADAPTRALRVYGERVYPSLQAAMTPLSNRVPVPLFDAVLAGVVIAGLTTLFMSIRRTWRGRSLRPVLRFLWGATVAAASIYLWFVLAWGYNYRRPGVESALPAYEAGRATPARVRALAARAVAQVNALHDPAHAQGFPALESAPDPLVESLHRLEHRLGRPRPTVPSSPKRPWTALYMRAAGVSGMLAPLFLETYLNPDLTGPERPYVLAHEWAHLSGYAPEEDASFVGLLTALDADVPARYSAWLFLVSEAASRLQPVTHRMVLQPLGAGPRADLAAIAERLRARVPWLDRASWIAYDRAIKSQGAEEGVAGYGRVIDLLLGSGAIEQDGGIP